MWRTPDGWPVRRVPVPGVPRWVGHALIVHSPRDRGRLIVGVRIGRVRWLIWRAGCRLGRPLVALWRSLYVREVQDPDGADGPMIDRGVRDGL